MTREAGASDGDLDAEPSVFAGFGGTTDGEATPSARESGGGCTRDAGGKPAAPGPPRFNGEGRGAGTEGSGAGTETRGGGRTEGAAGVPKTSPPGGCGDDEALLRSTRTIEAPTANEAP